MSMYEKTMLKAIQNKIKYLLKEEGFTSYDIAILLDDFIYENEFSNECNQKLWSIQDKYINMYRKDK